MASQEKCLLQVKEEPLAATTEKELKCENTKDAAWEDGKIFLELKYKITLKNKNV